MKTSEESLPNFVAHVRKDIGSTIANAKEAGITDEEIDAIISKNYEENQNLAIARVVSRIRKLLISQIDLKSATSVRGCIIGSRDKAGKNSPIRYLLLKTDKNHMELSNFGHKTHYKLEAEYPIPVPSLVTVRVTLDRAFGSWNLAGIDEIKKEHLDHKTIVEVFNKCKIPINAITKDMTFDREKERPASPVVIYGKIAAIQNEVIFKERENRSDKAEVERTLNVWEMTESGFKPCFSFAIKGGKGRFVRCHIEHQKYGTPLVMIEDINNLCERAVQKYPDDPKAQANYLNEWLGDLDVIIAGVPSSYREGFDREKRPTTNIEIGVAAVVEVSANEIEEGESGQSKIPEEPPKKEEPPAEQDKPKPLRPSDGGPTILVRSIMDDVKLWCKASGLEPKNVTVAILKEKAANRYGDVPEGTIMEVVDRITRGE